MKKTLLCIFFQLIFILLSKSQNSNISELKTLNITSSLNNQQEIYISKFLNEILYIPLETKSEALISSSAIIEVTSEFIIVKNRPKGMYQILLFDRKDGKFIREIGKQGRGPGEYLVWSLIPYNPKTKEFYAIGASRNLLVYDLSGKYIYKIQEQDGKLNALPHGYFNFIDNNTFIGYIHNSSNQDTRKFVLLTKAGLSSTLLFKQNSINNGLITPLNSLLSFRWNDKVNFIETFCDTLYQVNGLSLLPRYFLDLNEPSIFNSKQSFGNQYYPYLIDIDENNDYLFFKFYSGAHYLGFVDKRNNIVTFCKKNDSELSGYKDDINGLMDIIPQDFTQKNEMVFVIYPVDLINWLKRNSAEAQVAQDKVPWIKNIDEFSNPIIAIGKCKE